MPFLMVSLNCAVALSVIINFRIRIIDFRIWDEPLQDRCVEQINRIGDRKKRCSR